MKKISYAYRKVALL